MFNLSDGMKKHSQIELEGRCNVMQQHRCGRSGLVLPSISLGFWHSFGANVPYETQKRIVLRAFEHGIYHFDLADCYGPPDGAAEEVFGAILNRELRQHRDQILVATKAGAPLGDHPYQSGGSAKHLISSIDRSLERLNLEYVDIFYHHRPDPETDMQETADALSRIVRQGKAFYIGLSNYSAEQLTEMAELLRMNRTPCVIFQSRYSMLDQNYRTDGLLDVVQRFNMGSIAYSVLAQGVLTGKYSKGIPNDSRIATDPRYLKASAVTDDIINKVNALTEIAVQRGQTMAQMALGWAKCTGRFTSLLIGASRPSQIDENVAALKHLEFTPDELREIDGILGTKA